MVAADIAGNSGTSGDAVGVISVTNTSGDDTGPVITNVSYSPTSIDVSNGAQTITVSADVNDANNISILEQF